MMTRASLNDRERDGEHRAAVDRRIGARLHNVVDERNELVGRRTHLLRRAVVVDGPQDHARHPLDRRRGFLRHLDRLLPFGRRAAVEDKHPAEEAEGEREDDEREKAPHRIQAVAAMSPSWPPATVVSVDGVVLFMIQSPRVKRFPWSPTRSFA